MNLTESDVNWKVLDTVANERIYISDEDVYGHIVKRGAYASLVSYKVGGIEYEVMMINEDFTIVEEIEEEY